MGGFKEFWQKRDPTPGTEVNEAMEGIIIVSIMPTALFRSCRGMDGAPIWAWFM
jgi:hypothetical protein